MLINRLHAELRIITFGPLLNVFYDIYRLIYVRPHYRTFRYHEEFVDRLVKNTSACRGFCVNCQLVIDLIPAINSNFFDRYFKD